MQSREGPGGPHQGDVATIASVAGDAATLVSDTLPASGQANPEAPPILPRGTIVGRYELLGHLGSGGMGVVYEARDPELERSVAIKLLRSGGGAADSVRLLREARALARLAHPNIVAVHDVGAVGEAGDQLFIAMELVDGVTARAWQRERPRTVAEILAVYTAAARGLAAAHHAGLVHRDFKPDNLMIGADGRARVMDFGLARSEHSALATPGSHSAPQHGSVGPVTEPDARLTRDGSLLGTPLYMAPEQWDGRSVDARTDQFSLCVAMWEALYDARPFRGATMMEMMAAVTRGTITPPQDPPRRVPSWLTAVLTRGLARDPQRRWPSMDALLAALARGQARQRRRPLLFAGLAVGLGLAGMFGLRVQRTAACAAEGAAIADTYNDEVGAALHTALRSTHLAYAESSYAKALPHLARWTADWSAARAEICDQTYVAGAVPEDMYKQSAACLDEARDGLAALLAVHTAEPAAHLARLVPAFAELPPVDECSDLAALARRPAPPDPAIREQVRALQRELLRTRGRLPELCSAADLAAAEKHLAAAEALAHRPLIVAARALVADVATCKDDPALAEKLLRQVYVEAEALGADEAAATAAIRLLSTIGRDRGRAAEALQWVAPAEVILQRIGQTRGLLGADLLHRRAMVLRNRGDRDEALEDLQRALEIREEVLGPDHPRIATTLNALGAVHRSRNDRDAALAVQTRALEIRRAALGADHPETGVAANDLGLLEQARGNYDAASKYLNESLLIAEAAKNDREVALVLNNRGRLQQLRGDLTAASRDLERSLEIREALPGSHDLDIAATLHNLGLLRLLQGDRPAARDLLERALKLRERKLDDAHPELVTTLNDLGTVYYRIGEFTKALDMHERALEIQRRSSTADRDIANSLRNLALVRDELGEHTRALALATEAVTLGERALSPEHPDMTTLLNTLGMLQRRDDPAAAEATISRALAISVRARGNRHPATATSLLRLGEVHLDRKNFIKARASLDEALAIREGLGHDTPEVADVLFVLGELALAQSKPDEAAPLLTRALEIRGKPGVPARQLAETRFALARALATTDKPRSRELAEQARVALQSDPAASAELSAVQAWQKSHK